MARWDALVKEALEGGLLPEVDRQQMYENFDTKKERICFLCFAVGSWREYKPHAVPPDLTAEERAVVGTDREKLFAAKNKDVWKYLYSCNVCTMDQET